MLFFLTTSMAAIRSDALKISITLRFVKPKRALFYYSWCNIWNADKFKRWALVQASAQSEVLYLIVHLFLKILRHHFEGKICQRKGPVDYSRWQLLTENLPQCCCLVTTLKRKKWFLRAFFFSYTRYNLLHVAYLSAIKKDRNSLKHSFIHWPWFVMHFNTFLFILQSPKRQQNQLPSGIYHLKPTAQGLISLTNTTRNIKLLQ